MNRTYRFFLALVLTCIIGSAMFISYKVFFSSPARSLPVLRGSSVVEAVQQLERMGIKVRIEEQESSLPKGTVLAQSPQPGVSLRADKIAVLHISRGTERQSVPDLRGLPLNQAVSRIQSIGFTVGDVQRLSHEKPAGTLIAQSPAFPASVPPGSRIDLLVSLGPAAGGNQIVVPDLLQRDEATAVQLAKESGLRPTVTKVFSQGSLQGRVVSMEPRAGARVARNAFVTLKIASWDPALAPQKDPPGEKAPEQSEGSEKGPSRKTSLGGRVTVITPDKGNAIVVKPGDPAYEERMALVESLKNGEKKDNAPAGNRPADRASAGDEKKLESPEKPPVKPAGAKKTALVRYRTPPVSGQTLVIEVIDRESERVVLNRQAKAGENIRLSVPYSGEAIVTISLGGNTVWQERYR